jgi:hypothetical protein
MTSPTQSDKELRREIAQAFRREAGDALFPILVKISPDWLRIAADALSAVPSLAPQEDSAGRVLLLNLRDHIKAYDDAHGLPYDGDMGPNMYACQNAGIALDDFCMANGEALVDELNAILMRDNYRATALSPLAAPTDEEVFRRFQQWSILLDAKGAAEFWDDVDWLRKAPRSHSVTPGHGICSECGTGPRGYCVAPNFAANCPFAPSAIGEKKP